MNEVPPSPPEPEPTPPPEIESAAEPLPSSPARRRIHETYGRMAAHVSVLSSAETLLKSPGQIVYEMQEAQSKKLGLSLLAMSVLCFVGYGLTVGMFEWGSNLWIAPLKVTIGILFSAVLCIPSLVIFSCLSGADLKISHILSILVASVALTGLLMVGFAPVAWIFTQSTSSVAFMGALHLAFWGIGMFYGLRFLYAAFGFLNRDRNSHILVWCVIFVLVVLQMTTTLRPILGEANDQIMVKEKKFFLTYWMENLDSQN